MIFQIDNIVSPLILIDVSLVIMPIVFKKWIREFQFGRSVEVEVQIFNFFDNNRLCRCMISIKLAKIL